MDQARYFALVVTMSMHMPAASPVAPMLQAKALERLSDALLDDERRARRCLDRTWTAQKPVVLRW